MRLFVEKDTDLMRSTFVAVGLAQLAYALIKDARADAIVIYDGGSAYGIDIPADADEMMSQVQQLGYLPPLLPAIKKPLSSSEQDKIQGGALAETIWRKYVPAAIEARGGSVVDYGEQKQLAAAEKTTKKQALQEGQATPRHPDFPVWAHLCSYFGKGSAMKTVYPGVLHTWHAHSAHTAAALLELLLACYGNFPNDMDEAQQRWQQKILPQLAYVDWDLQPLVTASSLVSPSTVQGSATLSAARNLNNEPLDGFWLELYLAFAGYMAVGMPFTLGSDVVLYYPLPKQITLRRLLAIQKEYRQAEDARQLYRFSNTMLRAKLDTLAHVTYYKNMVEHYKNNLPDPDAPEYEQMDEQRITGFVGYYYKYLGGTQIPFDETLFALPVWLALHPQPQQLEAAAQLLNAHYQLLVSVRGKPPKNALTADELILFNTYRRFITLGEVTAWTNFTIQYTAYRFRNLPDMGWLPDFHFHVFKETLMNMQSSHVDYRPIMHNKGFLRIAAAIRACTVSARYFKDVKRDPTYAFKVRHGLGDDLLRHAHDAEKFIGELSRFLHDYSRESSSVQADTGGTRAFVNADDIADIVALIHQYGSFVVAHLLVAAGYTSDYRPKADDAAV